MPAFATVLLFGSQAYHTCVSAVPMTVHFSKKIENRTRIRWMASGAMRQLTRQAPTGSRCANSLTCTAFQLIGVDRVEGRRRRTTTGGWIMSGISSSSVPDNTIRRLLLVWQFHSLSYGLGGANATDLRARVADYAAAHPQTQIAGTPIKVSCQ